MFIDLVGIIDDGVRPAHPSVKVDARQAIVIPGGEDVTIRLRLMNLAKAPIELAGADALILTARSPTTPFSRVLFTVTVTKTARTAPGLYPMVIAAAATRFLGNVRSGTFDIWLKRDAGASYQAVGLSRLAIAGVAIAPTESPTPVVVP